MPKALFIIGNKRSGTTQIVKLLNLHPQVFVSHESDIIWILYQFYNRLPYRAYSQDSDLGMQDALMRSGHLLDKGKSPVENYFAFQQHLMESGSSWLPPMKKRELLWIGDKKPFQNADPEQTAFILDHFGEAHFIHLIRHPFNVAASADASNKTPDGDFWLDLSLEAMVEKWTENEINVQSLKKDARAHVIDVTYEDLCRETRKVLFRIFSFLNLNVDDAILKTAERKTYYASKNTQKIRCSQQALSIMELYGYTSQGIQKPKLRHISDNLCVWIKKRI
jgi:hypothetical protein